MNQGLEYDDIFFGLTGFVSLSGVSLHKQITSIPSFADSQNNSHEIIRPHRCPSCPARFFEKYELKAHASQIHGDQMPFCCQQCGKGYLSYQGLKDHQASFHEGQRFICPICDRRMNYKNVYKRHLRNVHKSDQCSQCLEVFNLEEFKYHTQSCQAGLML